VNRAATQNTAVFNPVEVIGRTEARLARLAMMRAVVTGLLPIVVTAAFGAAIGLVAPLVFDRVGFLMSPPHQKILRDSIFAAAALEVIAVAVLGWQHWREARDFEKTAQQIDAHVRAHQEILTLAGLADPSRPELKERRSPLFAMLWRRAMAYLENFDPHREFRLQLGEPLKRASLFALIAIIAITIAFVALLRRPSPLQATAYRLRQFAAAASTAGSPTDREIAEAARDVARDLENPHLPPQQKLAELQAIKREIDKIQQQSASRSGSGKSGGGGKGEGQGTGAGNGSGTGQGASGQGIGNGSGGTDKGAKSNGESIKLQNDVSKAEAKLEQESKAEQQSKTAQDQSKTGSGIVPQPGSNPNQSGPESKPHGTGNVQLPEQGKLAQSEARPSPGSAAGPKSDKGTQGDTHLGDFPKPASYERFYKLGEKGPPIDIKDARYVTFRLPTSVVTTGNDGRLVHDAGAPSATTPYTNAPLKEQRLTTTPDEEQLLPPRYRDLIR
jgi:uncharacterized membrane protein YgcG